MSRSLHIVSFSGSLRKASTNSGLLRCALRHVQNAPYANRVSFTILGIENIPFYNADVESAGIPKAVADLVQSLKAADGLFLACPEYNYSIAPALKNALDWASRTPQNAALANKPVAICGAGGGMGTSRAQYHLRQVCVRLNLRALCNPECFANAFSSGFDANGDVIDPVIAEHVGALVDALVDKLDRTCVA